MKKTIPALLAAFALTACGGEDFDRESYGEEWPFTVDSVTTGCDAMGLPFVDAGRQGIFGITGHAVQQGYPAVAPIHIVGKSIGPFIESALAQCKKRT